MRSALVERVSPGVLSCRIGPYRRDEALELLEDSEYLNSNMADDSDREECLERSLDGFGTDFGDAFLLEIRRRTTPYHWSDERLSGVWNDLEIAGLYLQLHGNRLAPWFHGIVTPYSFLDDLEVFCPFCDEPGYFNNDPGDEQEGTATAFDVCLRELPTILQPLFVPNQRNDEAMRARKRAWSAHCPAPFLPPLRRLSVLADAFSQLVTFIHMGPHVGDIVLHCADEETAMQATAQKRLIDDWASLLQQSGASTDFLGLVVVRGDYLALAVRLLRQIDAITDRLRSMLFEEVRDVAAA